MLLPKQFYSSVYSLAVAHAPRACGENRRKVVFTVSSPFFSRGLHRVAANVLLVTG